MKLTAIQKFTVLDYPGKVACIAFTPGCNMRCGFCHNPEFVLPERIRELSGSFIDEEILFRFLEKRQGLLDGVVVSGGEPTIWKELPEFIRKIKERGFLVKLDTNGNHPTMLEELLSEKLVDYVAMDVKTSLANYPKLVGPLVKTEYIQKSVALLLSSDIPYEFRTTLIKELHTPEVLEAIQGLIKGAKQFFLQNFRPGHTLQADFSRYHPFSLDELNVISQNFKTNVDFVGIRN
ncbi:anaerobic ribonucleoside-triphosphate reductase activating protein [Candidatus Gracilibacteria bacterium]|nr:anaerobic ribonucleoside-triphosphate reductase activating protein [Candidatus Gracilibacteria bacterium]